jgi:hypothetical protein
VRNGAFISLLEPPPAYEKAVKSCENIKTWPVLVGETGEQHTLLSHPSFSTTTRRSRPKAPSIFFDTTEIDELLVLSVMTMTDEEKRQARETDPRSRDILDKTDSLSQEELMGLHGKIRSMQTRRKDSA